MAKDGPLAKTPKPTNNPPLRWVARRQSANGDQGWNGVSRAAPTALLQGAGGPRRCPKAYVAGFLGPAA